MRSASGVTVIALLASACTHERPMSEIGDPNDKDRELKIEAQDGHGNATRVTEVRRVRGGLEGAGIGALVGLGSGIALGLVIGDDEPCSPNDRDCEDFRKTAGDNALIFGVVFGVVGGLGGLVVGAIKGSTFVYTSDGGNVQVTPSGPPGSIMGMTVRY